MTTTNTYGRQVILALTNKSGGGVIAGDVVVLDTTNNDAFTTSTAGNVTSVVGVAQETIANNATGRVLVSGYAALVNVNASVTRGHYGSTYTVVKQATDGGASRVLGTFCQFLTGGATPDAHVFGVVDLGTGSGNYTSAITWSSGTSMPGSPATNQRITRTDLGLDFYYDGTRWLTTTLYREPLASQDVLIPLSANNGAGYLATWGTEYQLYLVKFYAFTNTLATNDGSHFWTVVLNDDAGSTITGSSFTTAADTAATKTFHTQTLNLAYTSTNKQMQIVATKTSTPGNIYIAGSVSYRLIGT